MNVADMGVTKEAASVALREYKTHRATYDKRDWEIERIYRAISKGRTVISAFDSIRRGGLDELGRPRLALMRADQSVCICERWDRDRIVLRNEHNSMAAEWYFAILWPNRPELKSDIRWQHAIARLPRIPPQYRPPANELAKYHLLWEADWDDLPRDPYLLRRIGRDAWVVVSGWELTEVEVSVLRAYQAPQ